MSVRFSAVQPRVNQDHATFIGAGHGLGQLAFGRGSDSRSARLRPRDSPVGQASATDDDLAVATDRGCDPAQRIVRAGEAMQIERAARRWRDRLPAATREARALVARGLLAARAFRALRIAGQSRGWKVVLGAGVLVSEVELAQLLALLILGFCGRHR